MVALKVMLPSGIFCNAQKHLWLNRKVNEFVEPVASISASYTVNRNGNFKC